MQISKLKKYQKCYDKWSCGYDYLRVKIEEENIYIFQSLLDKINLTDFDNSNFIVEYYNDHKVTFFKSYSPKGEVYIWTIIYKDTSVPICVLEKNNNKQKEFTKQWGGFVLYGAYFRLLDIWYIKKDLKWLYGQFYNFIKDLEISRADYRFDFFTNDENKKIMTPWYVTDLRKNTKIFYDTIWGEKTIKNKKGKKWKKSKQLTNRNKVLWQITGWRLWSRKAKRYLIRAYDKLLDSEKKGKFGLYADYFEYKKVYRVEYEFLNSFCKWYTVKNLKELTQKIYWLLWFNERIWTLFKTYDKLDLTDIQARFKYADTTKGYMTNCITSWINIIWLLEEAFTKAWYSNKDIENMLQDFIKRKKLNEFYYLDIKDLYYNNNLIDNN